MIDLFKGYKVPTRFLIFSILSFSSFPQVALACAVCFSGTGGSLIAYYFTTALLSTLPLALIGGFVYWVFQKYKKANLREGELNKQLKDQYPHFSISRLNPISDTKTKNTE